MRISFQHIGHRLSAIPILLAAILLFSAECTAQQNPVLKIDDDITRFSYSTSGRIAYATRHVFSIKKIQLQRDDIWICEPDGKRRRILLGEKFVRGSGPFSYTVIGLRWSPDGTKLVAELATSEMTSEVGDTREGMLTLLLDDAGQEITIAGTDGTIAGASNAAWMADGTTFVFMKEQASAKVPPLPAAKTASTPPTNKLFTMNRIRPAAGGESAIFQGDFFSTVSWNPKQGVGIAIEREPGMAGPPLLVALDPAREISRALETLDGYAGGLSISPSGKKIAYWIDNGQLEVRDADAPNRAARLLVPLGSLAWSGDETRILVKRRATNRTGSLIWLALPPLVAVAQGAAPATSEVVPQSILHDLEFRQFDISPDGKRLAVVEPGRNNLLVYPIS